MLNTAKRHDYISRKKNLRKYIENEYLDEKGIAIIDICLYDGFSIFDQLSMGRGLELNPEIYDFIERKANIIPNKYDLVIRFHR